MSTLQPREKWGSKLGFILAAAGSAVGLGNIAFFPKTAAENGGGLFLVLYILAVLVVGVPIMLAELAIGRASESNAVGSFRKLVPGKKWWIVGAVGVITGFLILSFYAVIGGWITGYLWESITGVVTSMNGVEALQAHYEAAVTNNIWAVGFFFLFMVVTVYIVYGGVGAGIERWSKLLMPILLILFVLVIVRGLFIDGAIEGLKFFFLPKIEDMNTTTLANALSQAFFSLSLGMGAMITYGSYLKKDQNLPISAVQVSGLDSMIAIFAGLALFPAMFALVPNVGPGNVPGGFGMLFYTFPQVFLEMFAGNQLMAQLFAILFFSLVLIAALTSSISLLEVVTAYFVDERGWARKKAAILLGGAIFLFGVPSAMSGDFLNVISEITYGYTLPIGGFFISLFCGWVWGKNRSLIHILEGTDEFRLGLLWNFILRWIAPFIIFQIILGKILDDLSNYGIFTTPQGLRDLMNTAFFYVDIVAIAFAILGAIYFWFNKPKVLVSEE